MPDVKKTTASTSKRISDNQGDRLSAALEAAHVGVFEFEPQTGIATWDRRVGKIWGIPDDEEINYETVTAGLHPDDVAMHDAVTAKALDPNGDGVLDMEYRVIPRNGEPMRWVHAVAKCSFEDNKPVFLLGTVRDVTERRRLQDFEQFSPTLESANIGFFQMDPQTGKAKLSDLILKIWGLPSDEDIVHETLVDGVHPDDVAKVRERAAKSIDPKGTGVMEHEYRVIPRDGGPLRWVRAVTTCAFEGDKAVLVRGLVMDITEKRELQEYKKLQEYNQLLVDELQHRVKNTLATVMSVIRLSKPKDNDIENYILSLEERLLSMSQSHSLVNRSDGKSIDIKTVIEKEFQAYVGPETATETELYDLQGPSVFIPPAHVRIMSMAIHELVTNASKHGALSLPNKKITITTALKDGVATFKWEEKSESHSLEIGQPKGGFGSFLLSKVVAAELQGAVKYEINSGGLLFALEFPLKEGS